MNISTAVQASTLLACKGGASPSVQGNFIKMPRIQFSSSPCRRSPSLMPRNSGADQRQLSSEIEQKSARSSVRLTRELHAHFKRVAKKNSSSQQAVLELLISKYINSDSM